jgi:hypothetical protein
VKNECIRRKRKKVPEGMTPLFSREQLLEVFTFCFFDYAWSGIFLRCRFLPERKFSAWRFGIMLIDLASVILL